MFISLIAGMQRTISAQLNYWRTLRELRALSDRDLNDLGIRRCDIEFIARKTSRA